MDLRSYLKTNGLSEQAFAEEIGVKQSAVNRYCRGRVPTPKVMREIIRVTAGKVTPNDFMSATTGDAA